MSKLVGLLAALAVAGCASSPDGDVTVIASLILGGSPTTVGQFPTVVAVSIDNNWLCTGTLVAPDLVMVAAHCVKPSMVNLADQQAVTAATRVMFDTLDIRHPDAQKTYAATRTVFDPVYGGAGTAGDLGLIWLDQPVTDRAPSPINWDKTLAPIGVSVTMVGYGISPTPDGQAGTENVLFEKASTACSSFGVSDDAFICFDETTGTGVCEGDSGGPAFAEINGVNTVIGVTSFTDGGPCLDYGAHQRTDAGKAWLTQQAPELGPVCATDADCGQDLVCNDDHVCEPAPLTPGGLGGECGAGHAACVIGACANGPDGQRCSESCSTAADCGDGFDCINGGSGGACWPSGAGGGGCSVSGKTDQMDGSAILVLGVMLGLARRRKGVR